MEKVRSLFIYERYLYDFVNLLSLKEKNKDEGKIVVLFNGFQKKTQKTPQNEIDNFI